MSDIKKNNRQIIIRAAKEQDKGALYEIFMEVVGTGQYLMQDAQTTYGEWENYWFGSGARVYVALYDSQVAGSYALRPNQPGLGNHIANGSYMVDEKFSGLKIGLKMGKHSIITSRKLNYKGIQFNAVVSTNTAAIKLWKSLGFEITGTNKNAFHTPRGLVDTYTMFLDLNS